MDGRMLARIGAIIFVAIAITATAIELTRKDDAVDAVPPQAGGAPTADPLRAELKRCQSLGEAGAADTDCLEAWMENRRRFLGLGAESSKHEPFRPAMPAKIEERLAPAPGSPAPSVIAPADQDSEPR
jgi:conjugative transfer region protein TrbK